MSFKVIESSNTLDMKWALTIQWEDGTETVEIVSDNAMIALCAASGNPHKDED